MKPIIPVMRTALEQIQAQHKPYFIGTESDGTPIYRCLSCVGTYNGSCATRKLADAALTDRMARTNQGENK